MKALIVDDEPLATLHLKRLLEAQSVEIAGEADTAASALEMAEDLRPDIVFLDIQMPGLNGLQMASALLEVDVAPLVVFVTGFSEHAVAAFENDALDYLVKPVAADRLAKTLTRARERLANRELVQHLRQKVASRASEAAPLRRLPVRTDYAVQLIRLEQIVCATARDKRVFVKTKDGEHRTYYTLTQLEALLPKSRFLRIHDSFIVNVDMVEELLFLGNHTYEIRLSNEERLPVGRKRYPELQRRLGLAAIS